MPLSAPFREELSEVDRLLGTAQRKLASLKGQADFDRLPAEVSRRLENKNTALTHTREALQGIPDLVAESEGRR